MVFGWDDAAMIAAPVIGSVLGGAAAQKENDATEADLKRAMDVINGIKLPDIKDLELNPELYTYLGDYSPEAVQQQLMGPSAMEGIALDPVMRQRQMEALESMAQISKDGMTAQDKALLNQVRRNSEGDLQSRLDSIMQERQQRGIAGGGDELAMKLKAAQAASDMQAQGDLDVAAKSQQARLAALQNMSSMAGNLRSADYGQEKDLRSARDVVNAYNARNAQDVVNTNVDARNTAQRSNLTNRQNMANKNVGLRNETQQYNKNLKVDDYQRQIDKAKLLTPGYTNMARYHAGQAENAANQGSLIGRAAGQFGAGYFSKKSDNSQNTDWNNYFDNSGSYTSDDDDGRNVGVGTAKTRLTSFGG